MTTSLSSKDVTTLLRDPSPKSRIDTAAKIASHFRNGDLTDQEMRLAEEIFRIMVSDAEERVREALAINLKDCDFLPHEVALALAHDVNTVALPMISFSEVLNDQDLLEIIMTHNEQKQVSISQRAVVSERISDTLINTQRETVVASLMSNEGAQISEPSFDKAVVKLGRSARVQRAMIDRSSMPVSIAEKLVTLVSDSMREELMRSHKLTSTTATDLLLEARERATIMLSVDSSDDNVQKLVEQLNRNGRLTASLVLRSLCMGDVRFFEAALSELADIPLINAYTLINDPGRTGLEQLWVACKMPEAQLPIVFAALNAAAELEHDGRPQDHQRYKRRLLELLLTHDDDLENRFADDDMEYLIAKMSAMPSNMAHTP